MGLDARFHPDLEAIGSVTPDPLPRWERFFTAIGESSGIPTSFGGDRACYMPALDRIDMPALERFVSAPQFYSTWWHELTHNAGLVVMPRGGVGPLSCGPVSARARHVRAEAFGPRSAVCAAISPRAAAGTDTP